MIKNLLFDLGGVIMDIRRENCIAALEKLGMENPARFLGDYSQTGPFGDLEGGKITPEEFHKIMKEFLPPGVSDEEIDKAFNAFLTGIPLRRLETLRKLRKDYNIYLLSNTNPIMWSQGIDEAFRQEGKLIDDYFDGMVTSFEAKSMKPDLEIFRRVIEKCGLVPEETIFFDDSQRNLDAAASLGFKTILVEPGQEFAGLLDEYLKKV